MSTDYEAIGLKVGLEIHQQLDTKSKLFCDCPTELKKEKGKLKAYRRLRPTQSELGQIDPAALFEFKKGRAFEYYWDDDTACLVELDEEPPHELNREALEVCLKVALMLGAKPVDEVHVMRKIVIDGSNTTGFQRTCLVALGGKIEVDGKEVPIQTICLEEDAARKIDERGNVVEYSLDRLGIPLIEIATAPVIHSPQEAEKVALTIGRTLRATGKVKTELGAIRQDLNISIEGGGLIEIKGVQRLGLISKVVEYEVQRQLRLLELKEELKKRGLKEEDFEQEFVDVSEAFSGTKSGIIRRALTRGGRVYGMKVPKMAGLFKWKLGGNMRFGLELAYRAMYWGGVGGIFHSDELPAYGISEEEVERVKRMLGVSEGDGFVLVAGSEEECKGALEAVVERLKEALKGVPSETRAALPDGSTKYMRPRPGAARMYPETDIPPIPIEPEYLEKLRKELPELPSEVVKRLVRDYGLNKILAEKLLDVGKVRLFERVVKETGVKASVVASFLAEQLVSLEREGVEVSKIGDESLLEMFKAVGSGRVAKEALPELAREVAKGLNVEEAIRKLGLEKLGREEMEEFVEKLIEENRELIRKLGERAFGPLMGKAMGKLRGKVDAKELAELIKARIKEVVG